jgi:hypothetical protein
MWEKTRDLHGVIEYPDRDQPFTVWVRGKVVRFCERRTQAEVVFETAEEVAAGTNRTTE